MVYSVYADAACGQGEHTPPLLTMHGPGQEAGLNQCEPSGSRSEDSSSPKYVFGKCVSHQIYLQAHDLPDCSDDGGELITFSQVSSASFPLLQTAIRTPDQPAANDECTAHTSALRTPSPHTSWPHVRRTP